MSRFFLAVAVAATAALVSAPVRQASACGGCFHAPVVQQSQSTQVTGHRMVLSLSQDQTTLWDQIEYTGEPSEFAWVLPIKGQVDIGLSSEDVLASMESFASVMTRSPFYPCPWTNCSSGFSASASGGGGTGFGGESNPVEVLAQEVVGPYETVQLSSSDGSALTNWLAGHGYVVPPEVQPIVSAYVADGFDFLAMKLVPGVGVESMRPVRITTPGASLVLPLRMVAVGTGAYTTLKLLVISEGRYEPQNFPSTVIDRDALIWDFEAASSNYAALRDLAWKQQNNSTWVVESSQLLDGPASRGGIVASAIDTPSESGYGDGDPTQAVVEAQADADAFFGHFNASLLTMTYLTAKLGRPALANDLVLQASSDQSELPTLVEIAQSKNVPPCPPDPGCPGSGNDGAGGSGSGMAPGDSAAESGCAASGNRTRNAGFALALGLLALVGIRRRYRRGSADEMKH